MSVGQAAALGIAIVAVLSTIAIFALAWRRETGSPAVGSLDKQARRARARRPPLAPEVAAAGSPAPATVEEAPAAAATTRVVELSAAQFGETRR